MHLNEYLYSYKYSFICICIYLCFWKSKLEHDKNSNKKEFKSPPQSPHINTIGHLWDFVEQEIHIMLTHLQQLHNAVKFSGEYFLGEFVQLSIEAVLKAKEVQPLLASCTQREYCTFIL